VSEQQQLSVPGRVNLIGEHIDYHNLPVLPMAIQRRVHITFRPRGDRRIHASSVSFGTREFEWTARLEPSAAGDWENYIKAAAQAGGDRWKMERGVDATVVSDLPPAAGLSSSSALITGFLLALLRANGISASFEELMSVLPEGEHFVGTRGGGMDHAAVLESRQGCALLVQFAPAAAAPVPIPADWAFLAAHSLTIAEKSGAVRAEYNSRRTAGSAALRKLGFATYAEALARHSFYELAQLAYKQLDGDEQRAFLHVAGEANRVTEAVDALKKGDAARFGELLDAAHASARDLLRISCPELDELVDAARAAGALGARLTGAGFGGFAVVFSLRQDRERIARELVERFYRHRSGFDPNVHLIAVEPSAGALHE
jgi:galactokinase